MKILEEPPFMYELYKRRGLRFDFDMCIIY